MTWKAERVGMVTMTKMSLVLRTMRSSFFEEKIG